MINFFRNIGGEFIKNVLIVEDDKALSKGIVLTLQNENTLLEQSFDIASARKKIATKTFDLIILDINLPDGNGLDFLCEIKQKQDIPIILLTANDMETDIVTGLEMGADDYITKPFSLAILRARVNIQLRKQIPRNCFKQYDFIFDFDKIEFYKNSVRIDLSKTEQRLLKILLDNKGRTVERSTLIDRIWTDEAEYVDENALSVTVKRLRDKLEDKPSTPKYIKTVYGLGYTWVV